MEELHVDPNIKKLTSEESPNWALHGKGESASFPLGCKAQLVSIKNFKVGNLSAEREDYRKSPDPKRRDVNGIHRSLVPSGAPKIGKFL